jgi:hypothetical protein
MSLNGLAKRVKLYDDQLEVAFLPYLTLKVRLNYQAMEVVLPSEDWDIQRRAFITSVGTLVDVVKLTDTLDYRSEGLLHFWLNRTGDVVQDFELFLDVVALEAVDDFHEAYNATRAVLPKADPVLHEGMPDEDLDPEVSSAGGKRSKKKSSH